RVAAPARRQAALSHRAGCGFRLTVRRRRNAARPARHIIRHGPGDVRCPEDARPHPSRRCFMTASRVLAKCFCSLLVALGPLAAGATTWPGKTVTIVVPWPPGGPSGVAARPVAKGMQDLLGQTFLVENRGGAGGNLGTAAVTTAAPDGYTLLITSSAPIVINPSLYRNMPFDPSKDLIPITNVLRVPLVLVAHPSVPANNLKELIAHIKAQKGGFQYA